jgi:hypothetical protein
LEDRELCASSRFNGFNGLTFLTLGTPWLRLARAAKYPVHPVHPVLKYSAETVLAFSDGIVWFL